MLHVTVLELPARWGDAAAALAEVDAILGASEPSDLVLMPEASLTGYVSPHDDFDISVFAEPIDGPTARGLARVAARRRVHLVGPLVLREGEATFNAMAMFDPNGDLIFCYRKRHPWFPESWATPGAEAPPVVFVKGVAVTVVICFDIHFAAEDAATSLAAADLLLFPSAWVDVEDSRPTILEGLARRFDVAVASANWGPGVVALAGQGGSLVMDARGECLARVPHGGVRADARIEPSR